MQGYLQTDPMYSNKFKNVWLWNEFPGKNDLGGGDTGIDLVALNFACMINGVTKIIMTKTDILDSLPELNVCTAYNINGEEKTYVPFQMTQLKLEPVLKSFAGWQTDITAMSEYESLPQNMKNYIDYINKFLKVPVKFISNGPGRDQIILA